MNNKAYKNGQDYSESEDKTMSSGSNQSKPGDNVAVQGQIQSGVDCLTPPSTLLGRTLSASHADYHKTWHKKKVLDEDQSFSTSDLSQIPHHGVKRKYSSQESSSGNSITRLPTFLNSLPLEMGSSQMFRPFPTNPGLAPMPEFVSPNHLRKSRPNSPSNVGSIPILPRSRVASIRRESDCSTENEAAHEKMVKSAQQVSLGFVDFCLDDKLVEERKRAKSLTEPISIFTNAFLPNSSSPSPTRNNVDMQKQCYSPSSKQVVRSNISYSPSPSPTPSSPYNNSSNNNRMRSMSPIAIRQISKRRYTGGNGNSSGGGSTGNGGNTSGLDSDGEMSLSPLIAPPPSAKRQCKTPRSSANASPLVRDSTHSLQQQQILTSAIHSDEFIISSTTVEIYAAASPAYSNASGSFTASPAPPIRPARFLVDPRFAAQCSSIYNEAEDRDSMIAEEDAPLMATSYCSSSLCNDANSSTTFSSRANTPQSEMLDSSAAENDLSSLLPPLLSNNSSDASSQCSSNLNTRTGPNDLSFAVQHQQTKEGEG